MTMNSNIIAPQSTTSEPLVNPSSADAQTDIPSVGPPVAASSSTAPAAVADLRTFFQTINPTSPYCLSWGKAPNNHGIFDDADQAIAAVKDAQAQGLNTWFRINAAQQGTGANGSVQDSDITHVFGIPVDFDCPAGFHDGPTREKWKAEVIAMLGSGLFPRPTLVWGSGNGIQCWYRFVRPLTVAECPNYSTIVKHVAEQFQHASWSADGRIFNLSRLMRVPAGLNYKRQIDGEYPEAKIIYSGPDRYEVTDPFFAGAANVCTPSSAIRIDVDSTSDIRLPQNLRAGDMLRRLMLRGAAGLDDPKHGGRYQHLVEKFQNESDGEQYIACHLQACGNDDELIKQAMMTPGTWCERNLSNKKNPPRELERHLEPSVLETYYPARKQIRDMNRQLSVVNNLGGKYVVVDRSGERFQFQPAGVFQTSHTKPYQDNWRLQPINPADQKSPQRWVNVVPDKNIPLSVAWINDDDTIHYEYADRRMGECPPNTLNLYPGFSVQPNPGDWGLLKTHVLNNICRGNQKYYDFLMKWMAAGVQRPGPLCSAVVLYGIEGSGKNSLTDQYKWLWKEWASDITGINSVMGDFNEVLSETNALVLAECTFSGSIQQANLLKGLITSPTLRINRKGVSTYDIENSLRIFILSNEEHVIRADDGSRRYFVLRTVDRKLPGHEWAAIKKQMSEGGRAAMLHELLHMNLDDFDSSDVPKTEWLEVQKVETEMRRLEYDDKFADKLWSWLDDGYLPTSTVAGDGLTVRSVVLARWLRSECRLDFSQKRISQSLKSLYGADIAKKDRRDARYIAVPSLKEARVNFAKKYPQAAKDWEKDKDAQWRVDDYDPYREHQPELPI